GVPARLGHRSSDGHRDAAEFRHVAAGLPLGLPLDVSVKPEAVLPRPDHSERIFELLVGDQISAMIEKRALLESKRVDGAQLARRELRVSKAELKLNTVGEFFVGIGKARSEAPCQVAYGSLIVLGLWDGHALNA